MKPEAEKLCSYCKNPRKYHYGDGACDEGRSHFWNPEKPLESERDQKAAIPEDLKDDYHRALMQHKGHRGYVAGLIERIGNAEANIARRKEIAMKVTEMYQRMEKHCAEVEAERDQLRMERDALKEKRESMRRSMEDKAAEVAVVRKQIKVAREERDAAWNDAIEKAASKADDFEGDPNAIPAIRSLARPPIPAEPI